MIACLGLMDLPRRGFNIGHYLLKVVDYSIGPILREVDYEAISKNENNELLWALKHDFDLWEKLTEY